MWFAFETGDAQMYGVRRSAESQTGNDAHACYEVWG